jgi:hypothetical protein
MKSDQEFDTIFHAYFPSINDELNSFKSFLKDRAIYDDKEFERVCQKHERKIGTFLNNMVSKCKKQSIEPKNIARAVLKNPVSKKLFQDEIFSGIVRSKCYELTPHIFAEDLSHAASKIPNSKSAIIEDQLSRYSVYKEQTFHPEGFKAYQDGLREVYANLNRQEVDDLTKKLKINVTSRSVDPESLGFHNELIDSLPEGSAKDMLRGAQQEIKAAYKEQLPELIRNLIDSNLKIPLQQKNLDSFKSEVRNLFKPLSRDEHQLNRVEREAEKMILKAANQQEQNPEKIKQSLYTKVRHFCSQAIAFLGRKNDSVVLSHDLKQHLQNNLKSKAANPQQSRSI